MVTLFRSENLENAITAAGATTLPRAGRALYGLNQLLGTRLCRARFGQLIRRAYHEEVPHWDLKIPVTSVHDDVVVSALFFGTYESAEVFLARQFLYPGGDVVELGASLGVLSAHLARRLAPGARLICVEPNASLHETIERTIRANSPSAQYLVLGGAVYYGSSRAVALDASNVNAARVSERAEPDRLSVPVTTLSEILRDQKVGRYTLVCDIEGAEAGLVTRDTAALESCEQMLIETHEADFEGRRFGTADYLARLGELGFRLQKTMTRSPTLAVHFLARDQGRG
jgi:FkbM family methyltransferase